MTDTIVATENATENVVNTTVKETAIDESKIEKAKARNNSRLVQLQSIFEKRKQSALEREKRRQEEEAKLPEFVEAKDSSLISNRIKHTAQDMIIKLPLDNEEIKVLALKNAEHIGNAFFFISKAVTLHTDKKVSNKILKDLENTFNDTVIKKISEQQSYITKKLSKFNTLLSEGNLIERSSKPIIFEFRSKTPQSTRWLSWCAQADSTILMLLKAAHLGVISFDEYESRVRAIVGCLDGYAKHLYKTRNTLNKLIFTKREKTEDKIETSKDGLVQKTDEISEIKEEA